MDRVSDHYTRVEFEDLLDEAESNARAGFEQGFVSDIRDKYDEYGPEMFLSDKQNEILERIAERGDW